MARESASAYTFVQNAKKAMNAIAIASRRKLIHKLVDRIDCTVCKESSRSEKRSLIPISMFYQAIET
eukprot:2449768-Pleurochrysis_carterae.AAC.2